MHRHVGGANQTTHLNVCFQCGFDDAYQTGGALSNSAVNTYNQYRQMGYPDKVAMELAQSEASSGLTFAFLVVLLTVPAMWPFWRETGYWVSHDGLFHFLYAILIIWS